MELESVTLAPPRIMGDYVGIKILHIMAGIPHLFGNNIGGTAIPINVSQGNVDIDDRVMDGKFPDVKVT